MDKFIVIARRFLRVFIISAFTTMATLTIQQATSWSEIISVLNNLLIAGVIGGISGLIAGADKLLRWEE
jgi:hypothetical protein